MTVKGCWHGFLCNTIDSSLACLVFIDLHAEKMFQTNAEAAGEGLDPVKLV